jgi:hypothetical protein
MTTAYRRASHLQARAAPIVPGGASSMSCSVPLLPHRVATIVERAPVGWAIVERTAIAWAVGVASVVRAAFGHRIRPCGPQPELVLGPVVGATTLATHAAHGHHPMGLRRARRGGASVAACRRMRIRSRC